MRWKSGWNTMQLNYTEGLHQAAPTCRDKKVTRCRLKSWTVKKLTTFGTRTKVQVELAAKSLKWAKRKSWRWRLIVTVDNWKSIGGKEFHNLGILLKKKCLDVLVEPSLWVIFVLSEDRVPWVPNWIKFLISIKILVGGFETGDSENHVL